MKYLPLLILLIICFTATSQKIEIAHLQDDGTISTSILNAQLEYNVYPRTGYSQLPGFPFSAPAHPSFKNFRNVTIADLDADDKGEILVCLNETLYALSSDGTVKWQVELEGTSNYPPAVADIDNDGDLEIALQTYGVPAVGNVYLLDHEGKILEGWPLNIDNHFFINAVTLTDLNKNGLLEIIASERVNSNEGRVHALDHNANSINTNWPVIIPGTPAFTPSVGDIDQDGQNELITCTTTALYAFTNDGELISGFPVVEEGAKFSYQSPIVADLNDDGKKEIITARHNELPGTVVVDQEGNYFENWPDYDNIWTFATPTAVDIDNDGDYEVFYCRPHVSETSPSDVVLGYDHLGNKLPGFEIINLVGSEGLLSIADIDGDGDQEIITASKASINGMGLIHAYHIESGNEVSNFPLQVPGFTFVNGAYLADINNDGRLDLTALSFQLKFNQNDPDTAFINVFDLQVPYDESTILFTGYKGNNTHDGLVEKLFSNTTNLDAGNFRLYPNPASSILYVEQEHTKKDEKAMIFNLAGSPVAEYEISQGNIDLKNIPSGTYFLRVGEHVRKFIIH